MTDPTTAAAQIEFLRRLRSVRLFRPDPVLDQVVDDLLRVARWTGSARNRQPWELVVIRSRETLRALAALEGYAKHLAGAPLGIALVMAGEIEEQEVFDEGRLSERLMLAAAAHGLGSCIGWLRGEGVTAAKAMLDIPAERRLRTFLSIGYPDAEAMRARSRPAQARKPLAEIVHYERRGSRR